MTRDVMLDREAHLKTVIQVIETMISDWELELSGRIGADTCLIAELSYSSVDVVQLIVDLQEKVERCDLPFEKLLMADGRYVDELRVGHVADFLTEHLAA